MADEHSLEEDAVKQTGDWGTWELALKCSWTGRVGGGASCKGCYLPPVLVPGRLNPSFSSLQNKNYKAVCLNLKPEVVQVRSFFEAMPAARPEIRGEVTWTQGSFIVPGGQHLSQVLGDAMRETSSLSSWTVALVVSHTRKQHRSRQ